MEYINQQTAKEITKKALQKVADFNNNNIEGFTFNHFHPYHKKVFLSFLKVFVNQTPCSNAAGIITFDEFFDVDLSLSQLNSWANIGECITYIYQHHFRDDRIVEKVAL